MHAIVVNQVIWFDIFDRLSMQVVQILLTQLWFFHNYFQVVVWEWPFARRAHTGSVAGQAWPPAHAHRARVERSSQGPSCRMGEPAAGTPSAQAA